LELIRITHRDIVPFIKFLSFVSKGDHVLYF
jgi:hypothetical protein